LVNPNLASVLIFQLVDFTFQVASEVWPEREAILEPELDVGIGAWGIAHGFSLSSLMILVRARPLARTMRFSMMVGSIVEI
jgi:hypothetical protein